MIKSTLATRGCDFNVRHCLEVTIAKRSSLPHQASNSGGVQRMSASGIANPLPDAEVIQNALQMTQNDTVHADLRLMEAWRAQQFMHPGMMLRVRQIRRANPDLVADINITRK